MSREQANLFFQVVARVVALESIIRFPPRKDGRTPSRDEPQSEYFHPLHLTFVPEQIQNGESPA
jgi:hypothetical protein